MTLYESASDRRHEQEIITTLASRIPNTMFVKLNMTWRVDYAIYQGHNLPFIFAVQCDDCLKHVDLSNDPFPLRIGGGRQRNLASDIDLVIEIPSNKFKVF